MDDVKIAKSSIADISAMVLGEPEATVRPVPCSSEKDLALDPFPKSIPVRKQTLKSICVRFLRF